MKFNSNIIWFIPCCRGDLRVCPIGLMLSGVSAGAAFVFLSVGPATNTVTMDVVKKMLATRSLSKKLQENSVL